MPADQPTPRRFKRKLTPFLCQELLYDYVVGALDADRRQAVEDFLPTDAETQKRLAAIKSGFVYTEQLSQFEFKPSVLRRLNEAESVVQMGQRHLKAASVGATLRKRLHLSPQALRASAAVAAVVLLIIAGSVVPWKSLTRKSRNRGNAVELAAIQTTKSPVGEFGPVDVSQNEVAQDQAAAEPEGSGDEEAGSGDASGDAGAASVAQQSAADEGNDEGVPQDLAAVPSAPTFNLHVPVMNIASNQVSGQTSGQPLGQPAKPVSSSAPKTASTRPTMADEAETASEKKETAPKGFVYRAFMTLDNIDDVAADIAKKIEDLGGEKAGEVELGWQKGAGRYYHFAMPEANQEKLLDQLRSYGPVRISKDPHPRIMPKGRVRIILWVDTPK